MKFLSPRSRGHARWALACSAASLLAMQSAWASQPTGILLRVSGLPNPSRTDPVAVAIMRSLAEFQRRHPRVEIVPAEGLRIETLNSEATTVMMIAADIAPDVLNLNCRSIDSFVSQGMVAPLDSYVASEPAALDLPSRIPTPLHDVVYRPDPSNGKRRLYAIPHDFLVTGLYFNRELFSLAGLPQRAPNDWKEMLQFARAIKAADPRAYPIFLAGGQQASWTLMNFLWSAGGEAVQEVGPNEWRAVFDSPEAATAYEFYYELVEIERLVYRLPSAPTPQEYRRIGMYFGYVGDSTTADSQLFGFGAVPRGPTGIRGSEINARLLALYSGIRDPDVQEAAWHYIRFMTSEEAERIRIATLVELGLAGQVNPLSLRKFGFDELLALTPPGLEAEFQEALRSGHPEPYGRNCNLVYQEMTYPLDAMLLSPRLRHLWEIEDRAGVFQEIQRILRQAVQDTNERMIGYVPAETMAKRRAVAAAVVTIIVLVFLGLGWYVARTFRRSAALLSKPVTGRSWLPWIYLFPAFCLVFLWSYVPLARGTLMAFQDYRIILDSSFVGLDNFANALFDRTFWNSLLATAHFAAWVLTAGFLTPILLAYALHLIPKHKIFFRTLYYLPAVISVTAVFFLWRELFGVEGFLNEVLRLCGFEARRAWTEDPHLAMLSCVLPGIWAGAGPGCLIYLAALKTIPEEQFEAAEIDGAGFLQKTTQIVFPGLKALISINFIGAVAAAFHGATNILIMTGGGPNGATQVASLLIFYEAFARLRFGPATAMAWIIASMLVGLTVLQLKRLSEMEFKTQR